MPWTEEDVATLRAAIVERRGARSITFSDQSVTFESYKDMLDLLALMEAEVTPPTSSRTRYAATSKGV